jgi:hypothetical protein
MQKINITNIFKKKHYSQRNQITNLISQNTFREIKTFQKIYLELKSILYKKIFSLNVILIQLFSNYWIGMV